MNNVSSEIPKDSKILFKFNPDNNPKADFMLGQYFAHTGRLVVPILVSNFPVMELEYKGISLRHPKMDSLGIELPWGYHNVFYNSVVDPFTNAELFPEAQSGW